MRRSDSRENCVGVARARGFVVGGVQQQGVGLHLLEVALGISGEARELIEEFSRYFGRAGYRYLVGAHGFGHPCAPALVLQAERGPLAVGPVPAEAQVMP